jgi:predicted dehydrogenase
MLTFLFGEIEALVAHDGRLLDEWRSSDGEAKIKVETNDFASMLLRFANGLVIQFQVSWNAPLGLGWSLDAFGSNGRILIQAPSFPTSRDTLLHAGQLGDPALAPVPIPEDLFRSPEVAIDADASVAPAYPMALSMNAMIRAVAGAGTARPDFAQAWHVERLLEAIRVSALERRWVRMEEIAAQ